jgi:hypothetical protein
MDGLWYNEKNDKVIAVSGQKVFYVEEDGTTTDITNTGIPALGTLCTFADFADDVYIANGVQIIKAPVDTTTKTTFVTDTDAPTDARFVANLNDYLLANNGLSGRIDFADTGTPETWAGEFFSFDNSNDQLQFMSVGEGHDRIYGFGTKSIDPYRNSGTTPFIPEAQEYLSRGSISKYSPVFIKDQWYFIDQFKNLCRVSGRTAQSLPTKNYRGLTAFLSNLYCEDAEGLWVYSNGYNWGVWNLPTEQKTFAYNVDLDQWAEWSYWKMNTGEHEQWRGRCSAYATGWQKTLIGDSRSGVIYEMSADPNKTKKVVDATNLLAYSEQFDNAAWMAVGTGSVTADSIVAPDGTTTADTIDDTDAAADQYYVQQTVTTIGDGARVFSVYLQQGTATDTTVAVFFVGGTTVSVLATVNWATKTIDTGTLTQIGSSDWYRVSVPINDNGTGNSQTLCRIYPATNQASKTGTVYAWGAQLESGSTATPYIKTVASSASRFKDVPVFQHGNDPIRSSIKTGFINRGDDTKTKFCNRIYGRVIKKNVNGGDDTLKVAIRYRDDMLESSWVQEEVDLYTEDGLNYYYFVNGLGSYTSRQWEIICTSNIDFQMSPPTENYDESYQ